MKFSFTSHYSTRKTCVEQKERTFSFCELWVLYLSVLVGYHCLRISRTTIQINQAPLVTAVSTTSARNVFQVYGLLFMIISSFVVRTSSIICPVICARDKRKVPVTLSGFGTLLFIASPGGGGCCWFLGSVAAPHEERDEGDRKCDHTCDDGLVVGEGGLDGGEHDYVSPNARWAFIIGLVIFA